MQCLSGLSIYIKIFDRVTVAVEYAVECENIRCKTEGYEIFIQFHIYVLRHLEIFAGETDLLCIGCIL